MIGSLVRLVLFGVLLGLIGGTILGIFDPVAILNGVFGVLVGVFRVLEGVFTPGVLGLPFIFVIGIRHFTEGSIVELRYSSLQTVPICA